VHQSSLFEDRACIKLLIPSNTPKPSTYVTHTKAADVTLSLNLIHRLIDE
jgi:hypothetical protein